MLIGFLLFKFFYLLIFCSYPFSSLVCFLALIKTQTPLLRFSVDLLLICYTTNPQRIYNKSKRWILGLKPLHRIVNLSIKK